jgi:hypothetical protein
MLGPDKIMNPYIAYPQIPSDERERLCKEAYRNSKSLRTIRFTAVFASLLFSGAFTGQLLLGGWVPLTHIAIRIAASLVICGAIWGIFGQPKLRAAVEKLKNAKPVPAAEAPV